jgi:CDP-6-deoxy-D-xylo-4-hexulose-3-dehydrase
LLDELHTRDIILIEDVCESHGATHNNKKLGSFGWASNFSFYYAHHMSTIEGGMICTNDENLYEILRMLRAHGMVREINNLDKKTKIAEDNKDLNPDFIFSIPAFNVRNNEIGAILGLSQLERLDKIVQMRSNNQKFFF